MSESDYVSSEKSVSTLATVSEEEEEVPTPAASNLVEITPRPSVDTLLSAGATASTLPEFWYMEPDMLKKIQSVTIDREIAIVFRNRDKYNLYTAIVRHGGKEGIYYEVADGDTAIMATGYEWLNSVFLADEYYLNLDTLRTPETQLDICQELLLKRISVFRNGALVSLDTLVTNSYHSV